MALINNLHTLILLDYEVSFKKCDEVPGFVITLKREGKETECILPYSHLSESGITKYIGQMYIKLEEDGDISRV